MAHRQVDTTSVHSSSYHTGWIRISPDSPWELVAHNKDNGTAPAEEGENVLPCTYLDLATQIHMQRTTKNYPKSQLRWKPDVNFHDSLRLPSSEKGILVLFEAMASEGIAVALSSQAGYSKGSTVEITFGAVGNTKTTIFKRHHNSNNTSSVSIPCRVCQEGTWNSFWVGMWKGKTYAGIGKAPGEKCLAVLDADSLENDSNNNDPSDAAIEDASLKVGGDGTVDNMETKPSSDPVELRYVGLGNTAQQGRAVKIRNLQVTHVPSFVAQLLETTNESSTMDVLMDQQDDIDDDALKEYQEQCRKAKARAEKFGIAYKEPDLAAVVPWSQARKLRANPQKGFITGIDVTDAEELAKQEARKARFGITNDKKRELETGDSEEGKETGEAGLDSSTKMEDNTNEESLPINQAWDNEELVRFQRVDPPSSLWATPPAGEGDNEEPADDEFAMETDKPTLAPEKIHIFSIDWAAFKQIRSDDLMAHFNVYGPSYVEWLSDLGCNIQFEDKFSAVRAMKAMALELPSPPPDGLGDDEYFPPDLGAMGWKLGRKLVHKVKNDRFGKRGTTARILMRPATSQDILVERPSSWPDPPPGFSTRRILGPGCDFNVINEDEEDYQQTNRRQNKRRRRDSDQDNNGPDRSTNNNGGRTKRNKNGAVTGKRRQRGEDSSAPSQLSAADRLNQGLSSGR